MPGPMEGIRVVELGAWVAGPSAAAILGDWGADVVKIEPHDGDPFRALIAGLGGGDAPSPPFELDNRNKRSVSLDLSTPDGREIAARLVDGADVFVTNIRPIALERAGLDYEAAAARNPGLVYASITGYGLAGEDRDRAAYDVGAFWSRAGVAAALTPEGSDLPYQRGGMGDHMAGLAAAGGVSAALVARARTG
ncbi:MAG: CoA transferase, partial [Acidimicrobiales bacterium]